MSTENTNNTALTYLQLISKDEKAVKAEKLILRAQESGLALNKDIFDIKTEISKVKSAIALAQRQVPYSAQVEYNGVQKLAALEAKLKFYSDIKTERFSDAQV